MAKIVGQFGEMEAEAITPQEIESWLAAHEEWSTATKNRYLMLIKLTYRLGMKNGLIKSSPARLVQCEKENNERVRYLPESVQNFKAATMRSRGSGQ